MKKNIANNRLPIEILKFGILLLILFAYFYHSGGWNENSRIDLIFSIVHEGRPEIDSYYNAPGTETSEFVYYDGHYYSDKAIGVSLLGILIYAPMNWLVGMRQITLDIGVTKYFLQSY